MMSDNRDYRQKRDTDGDAIAYRALFGSNDAIDYSCPSDWVDEPDPREQTAQAPAESHRTPRERFTAVEPSQEPQSHLQPVTEPQRATGRPESDLQPRTAPETYKETVSPAEAEEVDAPHGLRYVSCITDSGRRSYEVVPRTRAGCLHHRICQAKSAFAHCGALAERLAHALSPETRQPEQATLFFFTLTNQSSDPATAQRQTREALAPVVAHYNGVEWLSTQESYTVRTGLHAHGIIALGGVPHDPHTSYILASEIRQILPDGTDLQIIHTRAEARRTAGYIAKMWLRGEVERQQAIQHNSPSPRFPRFYQQSHRFFATPAVRRADGSSKGRRYWTKLSLQSKDSRRASDAINSSVDAIRLARQRREHYRISTHVDFSAPFYTYISLTPSLYSIVPTVKSVRAVSGFARYIPSPVRRNPLARGRSPPEHENENNRKSKKPVALPQASGEGYW